MRRLAIFLLPLLLALSAPTVALGQATQSFSPTALPTAFSVSTSTARIPFPSAGPTALIVNTSTTVTAYLNMGSSTVTATTTDYILGPGCAVAYNISGKPYIAAITASGATTLQVSSGSGLPTLPTNACTIPTTIVGTQNENLVQINGVTVSAGAGTTGSGAQRVGVAQDATTISGSAPGTAGTPSINVLSVQGVGGGTAIPISGTITVAPLATVNAQTTTTGSSLVLCASACTLYDASIGVTTASGYWLIYNATSAPANGAVTPAWFWPVTSNGTSGGASVAWVNGKTFSTGATAVFSSTGPYTQTLATASFFSGDRK